MPQIYFEPWGFVEHQTANANTRLPESDNIIAKIVPSVVDKLKDHQNGIFSATRLVELTLKCCNLHSYEYQRIDIVILSIIFAELQRKQGCLITAHNLLIEAYHELCVCESFESSIFKQFTSVSKKQLCNSLLINAANCSIQLGKSEECMEILSMFDPMSCDLISKYHVACYETLLGCAHASTGDFELALEKAELAHRHMSDILPNGHSVLAVVNNVIAILQAGNKQRENATLGIDTALHILKKTTGVKSLSYAFLKFNKLLIECICHGKIKEDTVEQLVSEICELLPKEHHIRQCLGSGSFLSELKSLFSIDNAKETCKQSFLWKWGFVALPDHPFSWIDYPPCANVVVMGADYQVWAHLDKLLSLHPMRYSWVSSLFLGSFHKVSNLHDKLVKRYGKFHLQNHAVAFLDGPSASKVQFLLSMKDFDSSNQFFYHDVMAGLTELIIAFLKYHSRETQDSQVPEALTIQDVDILKVWDFCKSKSKYQPALSLVANYLFEEGLSALGLLEAQKFGDFDPDMLFTKLIVPLQFTTRGINYGPALCYHIRDMHSLRPHEESAIRNLWISNKSSTPGHCRPQDQSLEAQFNNSAKNCFKLGTVENVLNKASMIQERESCHKNLKDELCVDKHKVKPSIHQFKADSLIRLRACWRKGLNEIFKDLAERIASESNSDNITSMHSKNIIVNPELVNVRKIGEDRIDKFVSVKITQADGWRLQNPTFSEILTVPRAITARQQKAALNHANQQVEVMSGLLLQATGMQVSLSEECKPVQLLKKDGKSLHFAKKSDLTLWLYKNYESAFLNEASFDKETDSLNNVTCMIRDCMFDFRHLKIPTCSYKEMSSLIMDQTVIPVARRFANRDRHFTFIQTFDRRADQTKGCTEVTRASVPISPLQFSGFLAQLLRDIVFVEVKSAQISATTDRTP